MKVQDSDRVNVLAQKLQTANRGILGFQKLHPKREETIRVLCNDEEYIISVNKEELLYLVNSLKDKCIKELQGLGVEVEG